MTAPDNRNDAVQFLYKHGDLTYSAAQAAVDKLCNNGFRIVRADLATIDPACDHCGIDPAEIREAALWDLLEEIDAQIDLAEEISPEFADKVQLALWAGQTKGAAE